MKALTVRQPWAAAIVAGNKVIENRSRRTAYRGPLLIHAGKAPAGPGLVYGAIIGVCDLVDCLPVAEVEGQPDACGPWCWILSNPRPLTPFACPGKLGLWEAPAGYALEEQPR
jgi:ASCH domain